MKIKLSLIIIIVLALLGGTLFLSVMYLNGNDSRVFRIIPAGVVQSNMQTTLGNITLNAPLPSAPATVPLYRGYYDLGGNISISTPNCSKTKANLPNESEIPLLAQQVLAPFGGIPPDAIPLGITTSSGKAINFSTGEIVAVYLESRNIAYDRQINGMPVIGQSILLAFGENGELLFIKRQWRTLTPIGDVPVISASQAVEELQRGETLNHYQDSVDVTITNITLGYYAAYPDREEETLEPVWIFSGPTNHNSNISFLVNARVSGSSFNFGNFTASPASGTAPLMVSFNDTSTGPVFYWHWDFGDGTNETGQNVTHIYPYAGNYTVQLYVLNEALDNTITKTDFIRVSPGQIPVANFTATPTTGPAPLNVTFTDTSDASPTQWLWDFGDGTNATMQNATHMYNVSGAYNVTLRVWNDLGSDTMEKPGYVLVT